MHFVSTPFGIRAMAFDSSLVSSHWMLLITGKAEKSFWYNFVWTLNHRLTCTLYIGLVLCNLFCQLYDLICTDAYVDFRPNRIHVKQAGGIELKKVWTLALILHRSYIELPSSSSMVLLKIYLFLMIIAWNEIFSIIFR